jgi:ABC-type multidrug transport system fused ATPase/permease subunit
MFPINPNRERAKQLINMFYVVIAFAIVNLSLVSWQYFTFTGIRDNPDSLDMSIVNLSDNLDILSGIVSLAISITTIVLFIRWFRRAYNNLHSIQSSEVSFQEGWAAGAWFIPFLNLVRPYQIMREIWTGTQRAMPHRYPDILPATLVGIWWALYLAMNITANISLRMAMGIEDIDDLVNTSIASIIVEILTIPAAIIAIQVIKMRYGKKHRILLRACLP